MKVVSTCLGLCLWLAVLIVMPGEQISASQDTIVVSLWESDTPPFSESDTLKEKVLPSSGDDVRRVTNVQHPTLTIYPATQITEPAPVVLVCPGGGYNILAMDLEGTEIAAWLNSVGVTAAVLKYRVPKNRKGAYADGQRAITLLRSRADEWDINPDRIGVLGFSAGAHLSARLSTHFNSRIYSRQNEGNISLRPDFAILIYPAYLADRHLQVSAEVKPDSTAPPTFLVQTQDDHIGIRHSLGYYQALIQSNVPAALHVFQEGGHGYGLRVRPELPLSGWPQLCQRWLEAQNVLQKTSE